MEQSSSTEGNGSSLVRLPQARVDTYLLKVTAFCNLNCTYCYMFNLRDFSFRGRAKIMPMELVDVAAKRMVEHAVLQGVEQVAVSLHGGEPMLAGREWIREAVQRFRRAAGDRVEFFFLMQTNAVLIDPQWISLFRELGIVVGVSLDGPPEVNDRTRIDFAGRGSYDRAVRGLRLLLEIPDEDRVFSGVLSVVDPTSDGLAIYQHFRQLGVKRMDFLLPLENNWDAPPTGWRKDGGTPYADYLLPIFEAWWAERDPQVSVRIFDTVLRHLLGERKGVDSLGGNPVTFATIDTDGSLEPLDSFRACADGLTGLGLDIRRDPVAALYDHWLYQAAIAGQGGLCEVCSACPLHDVCGGGYLPHRYRRDNGFDNPSIYCHDLWKLINRILQAAVAELPPEIAGRRQDQMLQPAVM